jgi:hypothetical protein
MNSFACKSTPSTPTAPATQKPATPVSPSPKPNKGSWCVPKQGISNTQLQSNLDYACGHADCKPIQPGGACFEPNTVASHAAYAMNLLYQTAGRNPWNCDFSQTATLSSNNPSKFLHKPSFIPFCHMATQSSSINQVILGFILIKFDIYNIRIIIK